MKTAVWTAIAAAAMLVASAGRGQSPTSKPALPLGYVTIKDAGYGTFEDLFKVCELTAEQQKKILDIGAAKTKAVKDALASRNAIRDAVNKARAEGDKDALTKAIAKEKESYKPIVDADTKAQADNDKVLTVEQKAKWREYTTLKSVKLLYADVKFTDAQWDKIMAAYEKLAKDPSNSYWLIRIKLNAKINDILTREQKAKRLLDTRKYALLNKSVHFTDDQVQKLVQIEDDRVKEISELEAKNAAKQAELQQALQDAQSGDKDALAAAQSDLAQLNKTYADANQKYNDKVQAILTDTQKTAWQKATKLNPSWQTTPGGMQPE